MISFDPLRHYMQKHGKSIYSLSRDRIVGGATLDKIRNDSQGITIDTISRICAYLHCRITDVITYIPDPNTDTKKPPGL